MRRGFWDGGMDWVPKGTDSESEWESDSGLELGGGVSGDMGGLYHSWLCLSAFARLRFLRSALHKGRHGLFVLTDVKHAHAKRARGVWGDKFPPRRPRVSGARDSALYIRTGEIIPALA